ncbi:dihydrolipoamide branched chain transacylase E2 [Trichodelitschia bisporula]|uniref:Dihydrolipoamide acetyltransferase component of pyruvate dehydrogenase complex n=1 Tax=Trichodelitschia bisporula TaxID=703511 RepID=A0A6G1HZ81_9PEZI|nr:dihydrolipoamide branched chain transacylase E2 [Trichodelitschia bisporula]
MSSHGVRSVYHSLVCASHPAQHVSRRFRSFSIPRKQTPRSFHSAARLAVVKPYLLADIGEGITECQIIQWFVQPGARVSQFDKICEVQSDKAAVEITSRFDGVIKKLYYEADDMAKVGKPLVDIDIQNELSPEDEALTKVPETQRAAETGAEASGNAQPHLQTGPQTGQISLRPEDKKPAPTVPSGKHRALATPAVRHLTKQLNIVITDVPGTGKDGRVLKEDVQRFAQTQNQEPADTSPGQSPVMLGEDRTIRLTPIQSQMFKAMTNSLSIPHFLYSDHIDFTSLNSLRRTINRASPPAKLSALPIVMKAASLALSAFPALNSHLDTTTDAEKPILTQKAAHNIGFAVDTPQGLLVPVVKNVQTFSILALATEILRLSNLARDGKLTTADFSGATFTISNIGSIGGGVVTPIIVAPQVAILGVGKVKVVPAFAEDGSLVKREDCVFSLSADHRVVDGAMAAKFSEALKRYLEEPGAMLVSLR